MTDATSQKVLWRWEGGPFGTNAPNQDPQSTGTQFVYNLRFPGQYWDNEISRMNNGFRDYDPNLGRYIESDPIGLGGGINTYGYVKGNPLVFLDPDGQVGIPVYVPNKKVINGARDGAAKFGYDLSLCSDNDILGFVNGIPQDMADSFESSWDNRPNGNSTSWNSEQLNRYKKEKAKEQSLIDQFINKWSQIHADQCKCIKRKK